MTALVTALALWAALAGGTSAWAQPGPGARGGCCVVQGIAYNCSDKTQADCLAIQPAAPTFPKVDDWKKAWDAYIAASKAQEAKPTHGGWIAESCRPDASGRREPVTPERGQAPVRSQSVTSFQVPSGS